MVEISESLKRLVFKRRRDEGVLIKTLMTDYDISKVSVYRYLGEAEKLIAHRS